MKDVLSAVTLQQIIDPDTATADVTSAAVDMAGFADVAFAVLVGASGDTLSGSVKIELEVQESDDNSTYTAVANANLSSSVTGTNVGTFAVIDDGAEDDAVYSVKYLGSKRYLKVVANLTGTHSNGTPIGAVAIKSGERYLP